MLGTWRCPVCLTARECHCHQISKSPWNGWTMTLVWICELNLIVILKSDTASKGHFWQLHWTPAISKMGSRPVVLWGHHPQTCHSQCGTLLGTTGARSLFKVLEKLWVVDSGDHSTMAFCKQLEIGPKRLSLEIQWKVALRFKVGEVPKSCLT